MNKDIMKTLAFLLLLGIHGATAVKHSMKYIATAIFGFDGFPEYREVGFVDGQEFVHYDSHLKKIIPKTDWIEKNVGADYWERETKRNINTEQSFKANVVIAMGRFNQTGGVHIAQRMVGCEWDDETGDINGYLQFGYDGEDFIAFNLKTETWITPKPEAVITKHKWDHNKAHTAQWKNYLTHICPEWGNKYVNYGRRSLLRTVLPSVSLLQKSPSSPVSCHATGFYPDRATMFWRKDGGKLHEDVDHGEILPNHDGTFQMRVDLNISSVKPEDWRRYNCVFQLSGVEDDIITKLDKAVIRTNETSMGVIIAMVAGVFLVVLISLIGFIIYRKKTRDAKRPPYPVSSTDVMEQLNPPN